MIEVEKMVTELSNVFEERQAAVIAKVVAEAAEASQRELVIDDAFDITIQ